MKTSKLVLGAFLVSGICGLLGEVIWVLLSAALGSAPSIVVVVLSLLVFGVVGVVLVLTNTYERVEQASEMGIMATFCGLVPAAAGLFLKATGESGSAGKGVVKALVSILVLILVASLLPIVMAVVKMLLF